MTAIATIRVFCEGNPSLGTAVVNGLLAWAGALGGLTVFFGPLMLFVFVAKIVS
jgi:hypothetical protein